MYYDDMEFRRTAVCYPGSPVYCRGYYHVPYRFLREPTIEELLSRSEEIGRLLMKFAFDDDFDPEAEDIHDLWLEKNLILGELQERRMAGEVAQIIGEKTVFLCHSSADKGFVRMVNDDLRRLGASTWIDENNIKVGDSIVERIADGLKSSQFLAIFLSPESVKSKWALREWQSFIARQLSGDSLTVLPVLVRKCEVPAIIADLKYANFTESYYDGLRELRAALGD